MIAEKLILHFKRFVCNKLAILVLYQFVVWTRKQYPTFICHVCRLYDILSGYRQTCNMTERYVTDKKVFLDIIQIIDVSSMENNTSCYRQEGILLWIDSTIFSQVIGKYVFSMLDWKLCHWKATFFMSENSTIYLRVTGN